MKVRYKTDAVDEWLFKAKVSGRCRFENLKIYGHMKISDKDIVSINKDKDEIVDDLNQAFTALFIERVYCKAEISLEDQLTIKQLDSYEASRFYVKYSKSLTDEYRGAILKLYNNRFQSDLLHKNTVLEKTKMLPERGLGVSVRPTKLTDKQKKDRVLEDVGGTRTASKIDRVEDET